MAGRGIECCLPFVSFSDADQVVGVSEVQLGEDGRALQKLKGGSHQGKGVLVLNGNLVYAPIINARSQGSVLLPDKEESRSSR